MSEAFPKQGENMVISQEVIDGVRAKLIEELEGALQTYTRNGGQEWKGEEDCRTIIRNLKEKKPTSIQGPFYGDFMDGVLYDLSLRNREPGYSEIWKAIEEGR